MEATKADIIIRATPAQVMAVIADLPRYPAWSDGVVSAEVLEAYPDGRPRNVRMQMAVGPVSESCDLHYEWTGDDLVDWELISGGLISQLRGRYSCRDNGDGTTGVAYELELALTVPMIGTVRQRGERQILRAALRGLRRQVESLARAGESGD